MVVGRYDVIIIGGGIAGLYAAMKLLQKNPNAKVLLVERSNRLGGRVGNAKFRGTSVVCGAGVGRLEKDRILLSLLKVMSLKPQFLPPVSHHFAKTVKKVDVNGTISKLQTIEAAMKPPLDKRKTFKSFAKAHLGQKSYSEFVQATGYTDFEKQDAHDVLYNYGMDDNADGWTPVMVGWDDLVDSMKAWIIKHHNVKIKKNVEITRWDQGDQDITVYGTTDGAKADVVFSTKSLVVATTIESLTKLFPEKSIYNNIHGQQFIRLYAQLAVSSRQIMANAAPSITVVPAPLQEIIPINPQKGIYMIGYADNKSAQVLRDHGDDKQSIASFAEKALSLPKGSIHISNIQSHFWSIGTHYCDVLPRRFENREQFIHEAQRPHPNIFVVGEVVALNQGWVEGALQSVENVLDEIII
jgi:phytoene dehydrogenase-like protein